MNTTARMHVGLPVAFALAVALLLTTLVATPASASPGVITFHGEATLNNGSGVPNGTGSFTGTVLAGAHVSNSPSVNVLGTAAASFSYSDPLISAGSAAGTFTANIGGVIHSCAFTWSRTGVMLIITFAGGSNGCQIFSHAVATLAPTTQPGTVPAKALLTGAAVLVH